MGKRLSKIITRTGDDGTTGLGDGSRTAKDDPRIEAIGTVDELNSVLGLLLCHDIPEPGRGYDSARSRLGSRSPWPSSTG